MKKYSILFIAVLLTACSSSKITSFRVNEINGVELCKNPVYVSTIGKKSANPEDLSLYQLLKDAQVQLGNDVTITNVHWETTKNVRTSVIYDVVRCGPKTE